TYTLPLAVDKTERDRLNQQHDMFGVKFGGLYPRPDDVRRALTTRPSYTPTILDIGTGSGIWAVQMALEFPRSQVLGIDLAAPISTMGPPNCRFKTYDVNQGLDGLGMTFDVVHIRCVDQGVRSQVDLISTVAKVMRPGGIFLSIGGSSAVCDEQDGLITAEAEDEPGFSWAAKLLRINERIVQRRSPGIVDVPKMFQNLKKIDCWEECGGNKVRVALSPWENDERERSVGEMMRSNLYGFADAIRPVLQLEGYHPKDVDLWISNALDELRRQERHLYVNHHYTGLRDLLLTLSLCGLREAAREP
ncbi:hypothetical protein FRB97_007285, partial [Tulasnella sp. 331]